MLKTNLYIIDKNVASRDGLVSYLNSRDGYNVVSAVSHFGLLLAQNVACKNAILIINCKHSDLSDKAFLQNIEHFSLHNKVVVISLFEEEYLMLNGIKNGAVCFLSANQSLQEIEKTIDIVAKGGTTFTPALGREVLECINIEDYTMKMREETHTLLNQYVQKSRLIDIAQSWQKSIDEVYGMLAESMAAISFKRFANN